MTIRDDASAPKTPPAGDSPAKTPAATGFDDDEDQWRHAPVAPKDEKNLAKSFGQAIADVVTNSESDPADASPDGKPKAGR